jgi:hypothetical protein
MSKVKCAAVLTAKKVRNDAQGKCAKIIEAKCAKMSKAKKCTKVLKESVQRYECTKAALVS